MLIRHRRRHGAGSHHRIPHSLPANVRLLAWARAVRWIGWGLGEALIPIFLLSFAKSFAETGLLSSTVEIASLVSLPIIGAWADRAPARRLVLWSLALYPIVGIAYYFAGLWGAAICVVIARVANGFTWELENVGIETYYRRVTDSKEIASSFGYIETWSHVAWIAAALVGIWLVQFTPIYVLLLAIAPFAVIAYFIVLKAPKDELIGTQGSGVGADANGGIALVQARARSNSYMRAFRQLGSWNSRLWMVGALVLFTSIVSNLIYFFLPIDAYVSGANLPMVVLVTVVGALPALFSYKLGQIADRADKFWLISGGLFGIAAAGIGLMLVPHYWFKLVAVFFLGIILELLYVSESSLITTLGPVETYGERGSAFESLTVLGDLGAPLLIGICLDALGFGNLALIIACGAFALAIFYRVMSERK